MLAAPRLVGYRLGGPMTTPTGTTPQLPAEVRPPPRKHHRLRKTLLIVGGGFAGLIALIVIIALATSGKSQPKGAPSATPSTPKAQSYSSVQSLLAAMTAHGAICSNVSLNYSGSVPGEVNPFAECTGATSGDTAILVFTDHASALAYANSMIGLSASQQLGPAVEVVGPDWTVNTSSVYFGREMVSTMGGQMIIGPSTSATPAPAPTVTQTVTASAAPVATTAPAAPPADTVIAKFYGSGQGNTGSFTAPADGNWHMSYEYTNGSLFAGQAENFQVTEYGTDGTYDQGLVNALAVGTGQPTAVPVYSDSEAGSTVYFQVNTEDASWELVVLTGTS